MIVDQTECHEVAIERELASRAAAGTIRWCHKNTPSISEAMNVGALLARGELLLFLDDDITASRDLVEAHRNALTGPDSPPATCGQVLQPWHRTPDESVERFDIGFNPACSFPCEVVFLMAGNFAIRREEYLRLGGMDENFRGVSYRLESELAYRLVHTTGRRVRFVPEASLRNLRAPGGTRAFGDNSSWNHIGGSIGDYYFAFRSLRFGSAILHSLRRVRQETLNRAILRRPWHIPEVCVRELVAFTWALSCLARGPRYLRDLASYSDVRAPRSERLEA